MESCEIQEYIDILEGFDFKICSDDRNFHHIYAFCKAAPAVHYHVITWPYQLAFVAAHSNFVFRGIDDMFAFFRGRALFLVGLEAFAEAAEKRSTGVYEYSPEIAKNEVEAVFEELIAHNQDMIDSLLFDKAKIIEVVECEKWLTGRLEQFREMNPQFENETSGLNNVIFNDYSEGFLIAILSIGMAIKKYDELKSSNKNNADA